MHCSMKYKNPQTGDWIKLGEQETTVNSGVTFYRILRLKQLEVEVRRLQTTRHIINTCSLNPFQVGYVLLCRALKFSI